MPAEKSEPTVDPAERLKRVARELTPSDREGAVILTADDPGAGFILITSGGMELLRMSVSRFPSPGLGYRLPLPNDRGIVLPIQSRVTFPPGPFSL
jgi:hypothetical protein